MQKHSLKIIKLYISIVTEIVAISHFLCSKFEIFVRLVIFLTIAILGLPEKW
jgi:hypothetical protein